MNTKNIVIGVLSCIAIVFGVLTFKSPTVVTVPQLGNASSPIVNVPETKVNVEAAKPIVIPAPIVNVNVPQQKILGSVSSPDIMSPYFSVGGVRQWAARRESLIQASSTVCALQAPAATSTLVGASIRFTLASTTAVIVDLAKNSTQYSTTTKIGSTYNIAASAQATIVASSTGSVAGDATIFEPNYWFVVRMVGPTVTSGGDVNNAPTGVCNAIWREI